MTHPIIHRSTNQQIIIRGASVISSCGWHSQRFSSHATAISSSPSVNFSSFDNPLQLYSFSSHGSVRILSHGYATIHSGVDVRGDMHLIRALRWRHCDSNSDDNVRLRKKCRVVVSSENSVITSVHPCSLRLVTPPSHRKT